MSDHLKLAPVTILPVVTSLDLDAQRVAQAALDAGLETIIVIGREPDGSFYFASNKSDGGTVLWEMEIARAKLIGSL